MHPLADRQQETNSTDEAEHRAIFPGFARLLALVVACIYPVYWCAQFAFSSLPTLLRVAWSAYRLKVVRISVYGSFLLSGPRGDPPLEPNFRPFASETLLGLAVVLALGAWVLHGTRRRGTLLGGLFVAMLGYAGFERLLRELWFESPGAGWVLGALIFGTLWTIGLRRVIGATVRPGAGFGWRFAAALLGFTVPVGLLLLILHWAIGMRVLRPFVWLFFPGLVPAALASRPRKAGRSSRPQPIGWKWVAGGVAATASLATVLALAGSPLERFFVHRRAARARAMVASLTKPSPNAPYPKVFFQRGVNFTAEFGAPYASGAALDALGRLPQYGVNAVALVPYGWMRPHQPAVRISRGLNVWESDQGIEDLARMAHSLGMKVFLKPQLWVRGSSTTQLDFRDPAERKEWFAQYGKFIDHYARLATRIHADLFAVGVELTNLSRYSAPWRTIIAHVRRIYPGPLVYAANFGSEFDHVTFWNDLDYIGLDEYYPLPPNLSTTSLVRRVERVAVEYRRPVLFTEVGFPSLVNAQQQPWNNSPRAISLEEQERCYQAIFRAFYRQPWFEGMYWWKVGTNDAGGPDDGSFTPWGKPAMQVVREWYKSDGR